MRKLDDDGSKIIAIRISMPTLNKLQQVADQYGLTVSGLSRVAISAFLEKNPLAK